VTYTTPPSPARVAGAALGLVAAAGLAAFTYGALIERRRYQVRQEIVPILAPGARPITVLHLSDIHMAGWQVEKQDWIARIAELVEPDLVIETGDMLERNDGIAGIRRALAPLRGVPGAFVHGAHDYTASRFRNPFTYFAGPSKAHERAHDLDTEQLDRFLEDDLGWWDLRNSARAVELRGSYLEFIGVDDPHVDLDELDRLPVIVDEMRASVPWGASDAVVTLALTHSPYRRVLDALTTQGADLIFAGHTHGGQVRIPGLPALVTNCDIPREQASGLSLWHHARRTSYLEVSQGIGTGIFAPVRFACPPEAVVLTLVARDANG